MVVVVVVVVVLGEVAVVVAADVVVLGGVGRVVSSMVVGVSGDWVVKGNNLAVVPKDCSGVAVAAGGTTVGPSTIVKTDGSGALVGLVIRMVEKRGGIVLRLSNIVCGRKGKGPLADVVNPGVVPLLIDLVVLT